MHLDGDKPYILTVPHVLSQRECEALIERIEAGGPTTATIITSSGTRVKPSVRNNDRVIFDDRDLADSLFERVKDRVPSEVHGMTICGANERFRCYRYKPGMRFTPHKDGPFHRSENEQSWYTFMVYLNEGFEGGNTTFLVEPEVSITPETGKALLFQHALIHEGSVVAAGVKHVLRTDVMYRADAHVTCCQGTNTTAALESER